MSAILYDVSDGIATITINRPEKRNAMSFAVLGEFIDASKRAGEDDAARVVIVTGAGGAFCAGTDLSDLASRPPENRGLRGRADETDRWWPLVVCAKPVIAAVDGPAVGMGAEFTSQCDVRIASTRARFAWNFSHRGLVPDTGAGTWILPRLLGQARALELLYSGRFVDAQEALALGYVARVVEPEKLQAEARSLATSFLAGSPLSQRLIKELVYQSASRDFGQHMDAHTAAMKTCFASEDHREGVASFLERRPAKFVGR
ncbi:MAG TPA: enoyl-CoA hydratase-related protein [Myxococcota bacterium]|jgi:enoyl-CoA hydratase